MRLLTVGDSFTYGDELEDQNHAWPVILSKKLSWNLTNLGRSATGNTSMVRNCVEQVDNYDVVIVAWSHYARIETSDEIGTYDIWPGCNSGPHLNDTTWRSELIRYNDRHHNDQYLYAQYLINIVLLQNFLKMNNKRYVMVDAFGNNAYRNLNTRIVSFINRAYYLGWPNETMMEWTNGLKKGPGGHFLEEGHQLVAEKIYEYIRRIGWIS